MVPGARRGRAAAADRFPRQPPAEAAAPFTLCRKREGLPEPPLEGPPRGAPPRQDPRRSRRAPTSTHTSSREGPQLCLLRALLNWCQLQKRGDSFPPDGKYYSYGSVRDDAAQMKYAGLETRLKLFDLFCV